MEGNENFLDEWFSCERINNSLWKMKSEEQLVGVQTNRTRWYFVLAKMCLELHELWFLWCNFNIDVSLNSIIAILGPIPHIYWYCGCLRFPEVVRIVRFPEVIKKHLVQSDLTPTNSKSLLKIYCFRRFVLLTFWDSTFWHSTFCLSTFCPYTR